MQHQIIVLISMNSIQEVLGLEIYKLHKNGCEKGTDYNENSSYCTTIDTIKNKIVENNSIDIETFYPVLQFQPTNIETPIIILYRQYLTSKISNSTY